MGEFSVGYSREVPFDESGPPVRIDPGVLAAMRTELLPTMLTTGHESGGLLVGRAGTRVIDEFLPSGRDAQRARTSYTTDPEHLQAALDAVWRRTGGDVVGYAHSHPRGFPVPSQQDLIEAESMISDPDYRSMNDEVILPIATIDPDPSGGVDHDLNLRFFIYDRLGRLFEVGYELLPRAAAIADLEREMVSLGFDCERFVVDMGLALRLTAAAGRAVLLLPPSYPDADPQVFVEEPDGGLTTVDAADWMDGVQALLESPAADPRVASQGPRPSQAPPSQAPPSQAPTSEAPTSVNTPVAPLPRVLMTDRLAAAVTDLAQVPAERYGETWLLGRGTRTCWVQPGGDGLRALLPEGAVPVDVLPVHADFDARSQGIVMPGHLNTRRVVIVGAGSVGSAMAEHLVRAGVRRLILIDPDTVALANLCRSVYVLSDVGRHKVDALADRLRAIHPHVELTCHAEDVLQLDLEALEADLGVVAVDRPDVIEAVDAAWHARLPAVYPGIYERGMGGEVLYTWPGSAPLSAVLAQTRFSAQPPPQANRWDYSTEGRLAAEPALGAQIAHIVSVAAIIALAMLSEGTATSMADVLDREYQGVFISNAKTWIFDYPFQALWATFDVTSA